MDARTKTVFSILIAIVIIAVGVRECVAADGAAFLMAMLLGSADPHFVHHGFVIILWNSRLFSQIIPQVLPWIGIHLLHTHSRLIASYLYGISLYGFPVISLFLVYNFLENKKLVLLPMVSYMFSTLLTYQFIISESNVMAYIFWIVIAILSRSKIGIKQKIFLTIFITISTMLYNSFIFLSLLWLPFIFRHSTATYKKTSRMYWATNFIIILVGYGIELHSTLHPFSSGQKAGFLNDMLYVLPSYKELYLSLIVFIVGIIVYVRPVKSSKYIFWIIRTNIDSNRFIYAFFSNAKKASAAVTILIPAVSFIAFITFPHLDDYWSSFNYISLNVFVPLITGSIFVLVTTTIGRQWFDKLNHERVMNGVILLALFLFSMQTAAAIQWYGYTKIMVTTLAASKTPIIKADQTYLTRWFGGKSMQPISAGGWSFGPQSVLFADKPIHSVVSGHGIDWWSPAQLLQLSKNIWG
ncbi:MAG: hypothetical protein ACYDCX_08245 [Acidithiobacillus sp.]